MEPVVTALVAAAVAWLSIFAVVHLPDTRMPQRPARAVGGSSIALLGLVVLGAPLPAWLPVAVLLGGGIVVWLLPRGAAAA